MGFFGSKPKWVQRFYDSFGSKLQGWYNKFDKMDFPPETKRIMKKLCDALPENLAIGLMKKIVEMNDAVKTLQLLEIVKRFTF